MRDFLPDFSVSVPKLHAPYQEVRASARNHGIHHRDQLSPLDPHTRRPYKTSCLRMVSGKVGIAGKFHPL